MKIKDFIFVMVLIITTAIGMYLIGFSKGKEINKITCNMEYGNETCMIYNKNLISSQDYVDLMELNYYNAGTVIQIQDQCITGLSGRNDTLNVCNDLLYNDNHTMLSKIKFLNISIENYSNE